MRNQLISTLFFCLFCFLCLGAKAQQVDTAAYYEEEAAVVKDSVVEVVADSTTHIEAYDDGVKVAVESRKGDFRMLDTTDLAVVNIRSLAKDKFNALRKSEDYWYVATGEIKPKEAPKKEQNNYNETSTNHNASNVTWLLLVLLMIALIIIVLVNSNIILWRTKAKHITVPDTVDNMAETDNIFEMQFDKLIASALREQNYQFATRWLFLKLLRTMSEKNLIKYAADKTNFDYLMALSGSKYFTSFATAVKNYEYVYYGNFEVNAEKFAQLRTSFDSLQQQL